MAKASRKSKSKKAAPGKRKKQAARPKGQPASKPEQSRGVTQENAVVESQKGNGNVESATRRLRYDPAISALAPLKVLFVGDIQHPEFQPAVSTLQESALFSHSANCAAAAKRLCDGSAELLILGQRYPGEITAQQIERVQAASPASRVLVIDGSACEGEGRSGEHYQGSWRLYWHQATLLLALGIKQRAAGQAAWWSKEPEVVRLASAQTRGMVQEEACPTKNQSGVGVVCSRDPDLAAVLAEMLALPGLQPVITDSLRLDQLQGVRILLVDVETPGDLLALTSSERRSSQSGDPPVVAVSGTVRSEDLAFADRLPHFQILGKPVDLPSLELAISTALACATSVISAASATQST